MIWRGRLGVTRGDHIHMNWIGEIFMEKLTWTDIVAWKKYITLQICYYHYVFHDIQIHLSCCDNEETRLICIRGCCLHSCLQMSISHSCDWWTPSSFNGPQGRKISIGHYSSCLLQLASIACSNYSDTESLHGGGWSRCTKYLLPMSNQKSIMAFKSIILNKVNFIFLSFTLLICCLST